MSEWDEKFLKWNRENNMIGLETKRNKMRRFFLESKNREGNQR